MHFYDEFYGARLFMHLVIFKSKLIVLGFEVAIKGSTASEKYISPKLETARSKRLIAFSSKSKINGILKLKNAEFEQKLLNFSSNILARKILIFSLH